jgi:GxxExxY protein
LDCGYRLDIVVADSVIVEVKAVRKVLPIHRAQVLTYLKLTNCRLGLLINFNVEVLRSGLYRIING